jgi:hypothetical protein
MKRKILTILFALVASFSLVLMMSNGPFECPPPPPDDQPPPPYEPPYPPPPFPFPPPVEGVWVPGLVSPPDGSEVPPFGVTLEWSPCEGVTSYELIIATDAAVTDVLVAAQVLPNTTSYGPIELSPDTEYYWQVRALSPSGTYLSEVWSFRVEQVPSVISP